MSSLLPFTIAAARAPDDVALVRSLFLEYIASLGVDLAFQEADAELADLPGKYAAPLGTILIAQDSGGQIAGCCALRPLEFRVCEMKRLYVRPAARGHELGRHLAQAAIAYARAQNYSRLLLDTLQDMHAAQQLYASLGFRPTAAYNSNPLPGTLFLELKL